MHRVVTKCLDHRGKWMVDAGPWLASQDDAADWAERFRRVGYQVSIETMANHIQAGGENLGLQDALEHRM
ncbi:hypothetical protein AZSI13_30020 [Azospira sp. I13]|uniref:hypothetical protein n=1 Tax=Azospira sp. I13 TaxID=1765050 RepID=UPI000D3F891E|nr:hypothetical protein [Azospira sp. I13]GBG03675.1 hypothetical protein AZSI13_30020 [Azospira sp. I13]